MLNRLFKKTSPLTFSWQQDGDLLTVTLKRGDALVPLAKLSMKRPTICCRQTRKSYLLAIALSAQANLAQSMFCATANMSLSTLSCVQRSVLYGSFRMPLRPSGGHSFSIREKFCGPLLGKTAPTRSAWIAFSSTLSNSRHALPGLMSGGRRYSPG